MKRVRVSALAERDLDDIWLYVAQHSGSMDIANRVVDVITDAFSLLDRMPGAGGKRDGIKPGLRGLPVDNYIIYYREERRHVTIARILHGMRDQEVAFGED